MNKIELKNIENMINDYEKINGKCYEILKEVTDICNKNTFILKDILEKERIKNEKNIANANRYNREKREENNKIDWDKYPMLKKAMLKIREQQGDSTIKSDTDNIDTTDLD